MSATRAAKVSISTICSLAKPANGVRERGVVDRVLQIVDRGLGDRQAHIDLEYLGGATFVRMDPDMGIDL